MNWWQAALLGIVEGITEYLPISSTGHLILVQRWLGIANGTSANAYAICIQAGAIVAVLGLYAKRVRQMITGLIGHDPPGRRLAFNMTIAFVPAAVFGLLLDDLIDQYLFGLWPVVAAWFVGGVAILLVAWYRKRVGKTPTIGLDLDHLTWKMALIVGMAQCVAMWPGTSRSLMTIVGGVWVGLSLPAAVEFSFLLGVVTLGAATGYKALDHGPLMIESYGWGAILIGFIFALASAVVAVKWMVAYLQKHGLAAFGYYRVALALTVACLIAMGLLVDG